MADSEDDEPAFMLIGGSLGPGRCRPEAELVCCCCCCRCCGLVREGECCGCWVAACLSNTCGRAQRFRGARWALGHMR